MRKAQPKKKPATRRAKTSSAPSPSIATVWVPPQNGEPRRGPRPTKMTFDAKASLDTTQIDDQRHPPIVTPTTRGAYNASMQKFTSQAPSSTTAVPVVPQAVPIVTTPDAVPGGASKNSYGETRPGGDTGSNTPPTAAVVRSLAGLDQNEQAERLWLVENFGQSMAAFYDDPGEIGSVVRRAVRESVSGQGTWTDERLKAAIMGTSEYRNKSEAQRAWQYLEQTNPGEALARYKDLRESLARQVAKYGVTIDDAALNQLATDALRNGWNNDQAKLNAMILHASDAGVAGQGSIAAQALKIERAYRKYGLPVDSASALAMARRIAEGSLDEGVVDEQIIAQAKAKFPHMADLIDRGGTPEDFYAPYKQTLATELELNPESIDFSNPKWAQVVDGGTTGKPMTLSEAARWARKQPEWSKTDRANQQAAGLETFFLRQFGKLAS